MIKYLRMASEHKSTLRAILLLMLLLCVGVSYIAWVKLRFQEQSHAVKEIRQFGGRVVTAPHGNGFVRFVIGPDICFDVIEVLIEDCRPDPKLVDCLTKLFTIQTLLAHNYPLRDEDISKLRGMRTLTVLYLDGTKVTDACVKDLVSFANLRVLVLDGTRISDQGLRLIGKMSRLTSLSLNGTDVTDVGIPYLARLPQLKELFLIYTKVSDVGVTALSKLDSLESLYIFETRITRDGYERLKQWLPNTAIHSGWEY